MRISTRFTLIVTAAGVLLFGGSALVLYRAEQHDLQVAVRRELELLGRSLQTGIENALRDEQTVDVSQTLAALERVDPRVDVYVYRPNGKLRGMSPGAISRPPPRVSGQAEVTFDPPDGLGHATFVAPLAGGDRPLGFIAIVRPLGDARDDLHATGLTIVASALFYLVITALGVHIAGRRYVGRPAKRLIQEMRSFRRRDELGVTEPVAEDHGDEIAELQAEYASLQRALLAAEERLRSAAAERHRLHSALQRADKLVTVGQLAAGLAHEVGSPLQIIHGRLNNLLTHADHSARTRRIVDILVQQTERITRMVERLLGLTRARPQDSSPVELGEAVRAVVDLLDHEIERRDIDFQLDISPRLASVMTDPDPIQQVVLNLMTNALAASGPGDTVAVRLRSIGRTEGSVVGVRLEVVDTGCGMNAHAEQHAFDPFFTTREDEGGTGLGLAVVRAMTERLGGTVSLVSAEGEGTQVVIELPLHPKEST